MLYSIKENNYGNEFISGGGYISFDNTGTGLSSTNVQDAIVEVNNVRTILDIPANTYNTYGLALIAMNTAYEALTAAQKEKAYIVLGNQQIFIIQDLLNKSFVNTAVHANNTVRLYSLYLSASNPFYIYNEISSGSVVTTNNTSTQQTSRIVLKIK